MIEPTEVKTTCPYCGKKLTFDSEKCKQETLKFWYFNCSCHPEWTWCLNKTTDEWQYHDWKKGEWRIEEPKRSFIFR